MFSAKNRLHIATILCAARFAVQVKAPMSLRVATVAVPVINMAVDKTNNPKLALAVGGLSLAVNAWRGVNSIRTKQVKKEIKIGLQNMVLVSPFVVPAVKQSLADVANQIDKSEVKTNV
jgi:hypothetical protein